MKIQNKSLFEKIFLIIEILSIFLLFFYGFYKSISDEKKCIEQGYEGTVTYFGFPLDKCYIDNREFKEQTNKIEFYPLR